MPVLLEAHKKRYEAANPGLLIQRMRATETGTSVEIGVPPGKQIKIQFHGPNEAIVQAKSMFENGKPFVPRDLGIKMSFVGIAIPDVEDPSIAQISAGLSQSVDVVIDAMDSAGEVISTTEWQCRLEGAMARHTIEFADETACVTGSLVFEPNDRGSVRVSFAFAINFPAWIGKPVIGLPGLDRAARLLGTTRPATWYSVRVVAKDWEHGFKIQHCKSPEMTDSVLRQVSTLYKLRELARNQLAGMVLSRPFTVSEGFAIELWWDMAKNGKATRDCRESPLVANSEEMPEAVLSRDGTKAFVNAEMCVPAPSVDVLGKRIAMLPQLWKSDRIVVGRANPTAGTDGTSSRIQSIQFVEGIWTITRLVVPPQDCLQKDTTIAITPVNE